MIAGSRIGYTAFPLLAWAVVSAGFVGLDVTLCRMMATSSSGFDRFCEKEVTPHPPIHVIQAPQINTESVLIVLKSKTKTKEEKI